MPDILSQLPTLKWRDIEAPCESASYKGSHSQAERRYPYIDGAGHDWTGMDPYQFPSTRLHFLNTIKPHNWYPTRWDDFREALEKGGAGDLDHPDLGSVRARVMSWEVSLTAANRGGIVVDVTWTQTVDNLDERAVLLGVEFSIEALADNADKAMAKLKVKYPTNSDGHTSFSEAIGAIEGFATSTQFSINGIINRTIGTVTQVIDLSDKLRDHAAWPLRDTLTQLWSGLDTLKQKAEAEVSRNVGTFIASSDTSLDAVAREVGNTTQDLIELNLNLLRSPTVPKGSPVKYFTGGVSIKSPLRIPGP